jgi:hypothetical protein
MLKHAFKEWAVICAALARGKQAILLRKGGISEATGVFALEHTRFWLYPTYTHQQREGIRPEALPLLEEVEASRPPAGVVRLQHWAEVTGVYQVRDETLALLLAHLHLWSDDAVRKRFEYRRPGLNVLTVRVYRAPQAVELPETAEYAGCRSWVELDRELSTDGSTPVLDDKTYYDVQLNLDLLLRPSALA